jgi:hypothetical protein
MSGFIFLLKVAMFSHFAHLSYSLKVTFRLRFEEQINHTDQVPFLKTFAPLWLFILRNR